MNFPLVSALRWTSIRERSRGLRITRFDVLGDEPLRELKAVDAGRGQGRIVVFRWRREEADCGDAEVPCQLVGQAGLDDLVATLRPVVEPGDEDGMLGKIDHGPGAERRDDLALADLAVRFGRCVFRSCVLLLDVNAVDVFTQRFTLGSTSRSERLARNFILGFCGGGSSARGSGSR